MSGMFGFFDPNSESAFSVQFFGATFIVFNPFFHYWFYEFNSDEYYFYLNLGLSKLQLWLFTVSIGLITGVITIFL